MDLLINLLRSLFLSGIFSFLAPVFVVIVLNLSLSLIGHIPPLATLSQESMQLLNHFLSEFGSGSPLRGVGVIGLVCSLVGILFDTYTFYRYQKLS